MKHEPSAVERLRDKLGPTVVALGVALLGIHFVLLVGIRAVGSDALAAFYADHLALSPAALAGGRVWTLLSYGFVHDLRDPMHVLFNVLALGFFGPDFERGRGRRALLTLLGIAVALGGVAQVTWSAWIGDGHGIVGASAGTMALLAAFCWSHPTARVLLFFVAPVPARWLLPAAVGIDLLLFLSQGGGSSGGIAFFAHLGGIAAAWALLRGWPPRLAVARAKGWMAWARHKSGRAGPFGRPVRGFDVIQGGKANPRDPKHWN